LEVWGGYFFLLFLPFWIKLKMSQTTIMSVKNSIQLIASPPFQRERLDRLPFYWCTLFDILLHFPCFVKDFFVCNSLQRTVQLRRTLLWVTLSRRLEWNSLGTGLPCSEVFL